MVGDVGEVALAGLAERVEGGAVESAALPAEQLGLDRLAGEGVAEQEDVVLVLDEQAAPDEVAEHVDELVLGGAGDDGEEVEGDPAPEHGGGLEDPALVRIELVELRPHHLGEAPRQRLVGEVVEVLGGVAEQLLEEERVPAGAGVERLDDPERRRPAVDGGEEGADVER